MNRKIITIEGISNVIEEFYKQFQLDKTHKIDYKEFRNFLDKNEFQLDERTFLLFCYRYGESLKRDKGGFLSELV